MNEVVNANCANFKTGVKLSNSAKLLDAYMRASGVTEAKAISQALDIPVRTIQRLKLEIACATDGAPFEYGESANSAKHATDGAAKSATGGVSKKEISPIPPKEKTTTPKTTVSQEPARDDRQAEIGYADLKTAFNGSTEAMIADVMRFMGPLAKRQNAVNWLTSTITACGAARTAKAWGILQTKQASGEPVPQPLAFWAKTASGIKPEQVTAPAKPKAKPGTFYRYGVVQ